MAGFLTGLGQLVEGGIKGYDTAGRWQREDAAEEERKKDRDFKDNYRTDLLKAGEKRPEHDIADPTPTPPVPDAAAIAEQGVTGSPSAIPMQPPAGPSAQLEYPDTSAPAPAPAVAAALPAAPASQVAMAAVPAIRGLPPSDTQQAVAAVMPPPPPPVPAVPAAKQEDKVVVNDRLLPDQTRSVPVSETVDSNDYDIAKRQAAVHAKYGHPEAASQTLKAWSEQHETDIQQEGEALGKAIAYKLATGDDAPLKTVSKNSLMRLDYVVTTNDQGEAALGINPRGTVGPTVYFGPDMKMSKDPVYMPARNVAQVAQGLSSGRFAQTAMGIAATEVGLMAPRKEQLGMAQTVQGISASQTQALTGIANSYVARLKSDLDSGGTSPNWDTYSKALGIDPQQVSAVQQMLVAAGVIDAKGAPTGKTDMLSAPGEGGGTAPPPVGKAGPSGFVYDAPQQQVASVFNEGKLPPIATAALLGGFHVEHGYEGGKGDGGASSGIAQWNKERRELFIKRNGMDPAKAPIDVQARHVLWEFANPVESGAFVKNRDGTTPIQQRDMILNAKSVSEAARLVDKYYERSAGLHTDKRVAAANDAYAVLTGGKAPAGAITTPGTTAAAAPAPAPATGLPAGTPTGSGMDFTPDPKYAGAVQYTSKPKVEAGVLQQQQDAKSVGHLARQAVLQQFATANPNAPVPPEVQASANSAYTTGYRNQIASALNQMAEGDRKLMTPLLLPGIQPSQGGSFTGPSKASKDAANMFAVMPKDAAVRMLRDLSAMQGKDIGRIGPDQRKQVDAWNWLRQNDPNYANQLSREARKGGPVKAEEGANPIARKAGNVFALNDHQNALAKAQLILPYLYSGEQPPPKVQSLLVHFDQLRKMDPDYAFRLETQARQAAGPTVGNPMPLGLPM